MTSLNDQDKPGQRLLKLLTRFTVWMSQKRSPLVIGVFAVYALIYLPFRARLGISAGLFAIIPVMLTAWLFGWRGGLLAGLAIMPLHTILMNLSGHPGWDVILRESNGLGPLAIIAIGVAVGYWGELTWKLQQQIEEGEEIRYALQQSEERYRLITQNAEDIIWTTDMQLRSTYISPSLERALGYTAAEIMELPLDRLITPESLKMGLSTFTEEVEKAQSQPDANYARVLELEFLRKDASTFWIEVKFSFFRDANGQPNGILGVGRDITARKQVEDNLRQAETRYRTLVEQIPPIIYISGPNQRIGVTYISPRIEALGFTQEEWVAEPDLWFKQIHTDDQERILAEIEQTGESDKPFKSEYRLRSRDGKIQWFIDEAMNIFDSAGKLLFRQGFMLDITERKQMEESLSAREQYLERLNDLTRTILLSSDYDAILNTLAFNMKKIIEADDCYILSWDEERQLPVPVTASANQDLSFAEAAVHAGLLGLTTSILQAGHVIAVDDISNSPYAVIEVLKRFPARSIIGIPLIAGNNKLGAAILAFNTLHHFTSDEIERSEQAGNQVALALWNFQQSVEIEQRLKHSHSLTAIGRALSEIEHGGSDRVLQLIVDSALDLILKAEQSVIHIVNPEEHVLQPMAIAGFSERSTEGLRLKMQMGKGVAGQVMQDGITVNIPDVEDDPRFLRTKDRPTFQSLMVAPIKSGGQQIGTISIQSRSPSAFSIVDEELLNALAINAAIAIDNTRAFEATQQRLREVNALYGTIKVLAASLDPQELARNVVTLLQQNFGFYYVQLFLLDPLHGDLILKAGSGEVGERLLQNHFRLERGTGIAGHVAETGESFVTNNVNNIVFFQRNPLLPDTQYELAVPIKIEQEVVGVFDVQDKPPRRLTDGDLQLVAAVADQLAVALQKATLFTDLQNAMRQEQAIRSQLIQSERLALVGRLLASVSHELNNPLQAIQNALFLLREETGISAQGHQDLGIVLSETERMAALIERLRSAYRPIREKDFLPVQLNNLIEDVYALIGTHMRHKDIAFEFIPDYDLQPVSGISDQLRQVVLNLFLNAVEVMQPGGHLTVQTRNLFEQDEVYFSVKDSGPGIEAEILPQIFDAFITSKRTGTGLGLTITHDILEQHRGRISAANDPQGGAIFHVWLPTYKEI